MAITKDHGRQHALTAAQPFTYDDLETGVALSAVTIPGGAMVISGELVIETAFNSATSDVIAVGDTSGETSLVGNTDVSSAGRTDLTPTAGFSAVNDDITIRWTGSGAAPTAGSGYLVVTYVIAGRSTDVQP